MINCQRKSKYIYIQENSVNGELDLLTFLRKTQEDEKLILKINISLKKVQLEN